MRPTKKVVFLLSVLAILNLSNCSSNNIDEADRVNSSMYAHNLLANINSDIKLSQTEAFDSLTRSANSISNSLQKIAAIEKATHPKIKLDPGPAPETVGMANLVSIDWNGPAEPLLKRLTSSCNYKLTIIGKKPTIPLLISVDSHNQPIATVVRNIGFQIQRNANIEIFSKRKILELRYK